MREDRAETIIITDSGELFINRAKSHDDNYYAFLDYDKSLNIESGKFIPYALAENGAIVMDVAEDYNICGCVFPLIVNDVQFEYMKMFSEQFENLNCHVSVTSFTDNGEWEHINYNETFNYNSILEHYETAKVELECKNKLLAKVNIA